MAKYFNYYPKTFYSNPFTKSKALDIVTNITSRFTFQPQLKENAVTFYEYSVQEGDTPEIIAHKYYGHSEKHWIILLFNDIVDPQFDWPMSESLLNRYVDKKYQHLGGLSWAKNVNNIHSYYKIITTKLDYDGTELVNKLNITAQEHYVTGTSVMTYLLHDGYGITETITTETISYFEYEQQENEAKRVIKLLKPEFVDMVEEQLKEVFV
jgi:hypothetical protein